MYDLYVGGFAIDEINHFLSWIFQVSCFADMLKGSLLWHPAEMQFFVNCLMVSLMMNYHKRMVVESLIVVSYTHIYIYIYIYA